MKNLIKKYWWQLLVSSIIILLPALLGVILLNLFPKEMALHWSIYESEVSAISEAFSVLVLPAILLAVHWLFHILTLKHTEDRAQSPKIVNLTFWMIPAISVFVCTVMYAAVLGKADILPSVTSIFFAVLFMVMGNLMPKAKRNLYMGIKVKWALKNEDNWNATHRFGGKVMFFGGLFFLPCAFLPDTAFLWVLLPMTLIIALLPTLYSYLYYKKQIKKGTYTKEDSTSSFATSYKNARLISIPLIILVLIGVAVLMFTGKIDIEYSDTSFTLDVSFWQNPTFSYSDIESLEYREKDDVGMRINGFNSARLLLGQFNSEEFGNHTRFSYTGCNSCIVMKIKGNTVVISMSDEEATRVVYEELLARTK